MADPKWNLPDMDAVVAESLRAGAEVLREKSDERAPQDTGALIASAAIAIEGDTAAVYYVSPYAVKQHESLKMKHPGGGTAKFLELAATQDAPAISDAIAEAISERMGGR